MQNNDIKEDNGFNCMYWYTVLIIETTQYLTLQMYKSFLGRMEITKNKVAHKIYIVKDMLTENWLLSYHILFSQNFHFSDDHLKSTVTL